MAHALEVVSFITFNSVALAQPIRVSTASEEEGRYRIPDTVPPLYSSMTSSRQYPLPLAGDQQQHKSNGTEWAAKDIVNGEILLLRYNGQGPFNSDS